jgi:ubiquinone/menaquinone biosynthesis C-methylase UbiE
MARWFDFDKEGPTDYSLVSEIPGVRITREAASMLYTRYAFASGFCRNKEVLEVACGAGMGLGYLTRHARWVVGADYTYSMLVSAQRHYRAHLPLVQLDAQTLPFKDDCFDVVLLLEAIYYLGQPQIFLKECRRVLRGNGTLLLCLANKQWAGFSPSALSKRHFSAAELRQLLQDNQMEVEIFGGFPASAGTPSEKVANLIRAMAVRLNLIPGTMRKKEFLKRVFYGRLINAGAEIEENMTDYQQPIPIAVNEEPSRYKVLYALGRTRPKLVTLPEARQVVSIYP